MSNMTEKFDCWNDSTGLNTELVKWFDWLKNWIDGMFDTAQND